MRNIYYLFGSDAVEQLWTFEGYPETKIAEEIIQTHHAVFKWTDQTHPSVLLTQYDGWKDYAIITETLYNLLER